MIDSKLRLVQVSNEGLQYSLDSFRHRNGVAVIAASYWDVSVWRRVTRTKDFRGFPEYLQVNSRIVYYNMLSKIRTKYSRVQHYQTILSSNTTERSQLNKLNVRRFNGLEEHEVRRTQSPFGRKENEQTLQLPGTESGRPGNSKEIYQIVIDTNFHRLPCTFINQSTMGRIRTVMS
jgi:hypothetical protein